MAYDNHDFIQEDVLFNKKSENPVEENSSSTQTFDSSDFGSEVLFSTPTKNVGGEIEELVFDDESPIENLLMDNDDVVEEALFVNQRPSVVVEELEELEELSVVEEAIEIVDDKAISEENLEFSEPYSPTVVSEEVLFSGEEEVSSGEIDNSQTVVSDELTALSQGGGELAVEKVQKPAYIEKNFAQKFLEADKEILKRYDELKNIILLYKGVKSRVSNDFDSFNMGRTQLFKLGFSTQSLKLYLNLDYSEVEPRLKCKDVSHKKAYAQVPVFLRIKSPRAMRNAKYLIEKVVEKFNLKENPKAVYVDSIKILKEKAKTYDKSL